MGLEPTAICRRLRRTSFLLAFVVVAVVLLAIGRSRRRHTDRSGTGQFCGAKCANPTHAILKSSNHAQLRGVRPAVLRAVRGDTSRRKKICVERIEKLCRKPEYRHLFKAKVRTATIRQNCTHDRYFLFKRPLPL